VDTGQAIRAGSPRLARINFFIPSILAQRDLPPAQLLVQHVIQELAILGKGVDSLHTSLEAEIDQFHFAEEGKVSTRPVELSDSGSKIDHSLVAPTLGLVIAHIDNSQEIEEKDMDLKPRSGLRGLLSNRNKGQSSKDAPKE